MKFMMEEEHVKDFIRDIWSELSEEDIDEIVKEMRRSPIARDGSDKIPADWRPKNAEEYIDFVKSLNSL